MSFCTHCGSKLADHSNFCTQCGVTITKSSQVATAPQKTIYDGNLHICPHCGATLDSFAIHCASCGCELRGRSVANSVQTFFHEINRTETVQQKELLIRNFPIPNAKEDIIEFMILASSNILGENNQNFYSAWLAKFEQAYQKSLVMFHGHADFSRIQEIYDNCLATINAERRRKISKFTLSTMIRNLAACVGMLLMIVSVIIGLTGGNSSLMELIAYIVLIASASSLAKRDAGIMDFAVAAVSGLFTITLSFLLKNGSMGELCGGIVLIIVAVNYFKSLMRSKI